MKSTELEIISKACACRSFLYIAGFLTDVESEKIHGKIRKYQDKHRQNVSTDDLASVRIVMEKDSCTLGVGEGSGNMFVHGDYESIKHLQGKLLQMEVDKQRIAELEAVLTGIANANMNEWEVSEGMTRHERDAEFREWAQSIARHVIKTQG